jgi:uncharacterized Tic20 family protein
MVEKNESAEQAPKTSTTTNKEETMWAMFCHLGAFAGFIIPIVGNILGPLVIWLLKKDEFPLVDDQGKESVNFQISMTIYFIISAILMFVIIGFLLMAALLIFDIIVIIIATIKANEGVQYRYPLSIRFIS